MSRPTREEWFAATERLTSVLLDAAELRLTYLDIRVNAVNPDDQFMYISASVGDLDEERYDRLRDRERNRRAGRSAERRQRCARGERPNLAVQAVRPRG